MMNKNKSAKLHLLRFLFLLPVLAFILVSFRKEIGDTITGKQNQLQLTPASTTDTIPDVTEQNNKGYIINVKDKKGECQLVIKDKTGKEVKRMLLTEWNDNAEKYEALYGEIPPPPPPVPAKAPAPPKASASPTEAIAPVAPIAPIAPVSAIAPVPPVPPVAPTKDEQLNSIVVELKKNNQVVDASVDGPGKPATEIIKSNNNSIVRFSSVSTIPLYVVDGVVTNPQEVNSLDTEFIESVSVFKGESAIGLYGEKGKNGVVIIKTKKTIKLKISPAQL